MQPEEVIQESSKYEESVEEQPHEAPLLSLLYNSASKILNNVLQEPETQQEEPKSFYSFLYGLAGGVPSSPAKAGPEPSLVKEAPQKTPEMKSNSQNSIFNAEELEEFDFAIDEDVKERTKPHPEKYIPRIKEEIVYADPILDENILRLMHDHLPALVRESANLDLLFSIERNGISIKTLYENTAERGPVLLAVKDTNGRVFGAFVNESLHPQEGFYGNGSCFLWKLEDGKVQVYKATGNNNYYVLTQHHCLAFGGGQGRFGLWIDDELYHGHSEKCATFANEELTVSTEFCINAFEVWGFIA